MEITFEPKQNYILVYAKGELDPQIGKELFAKLLRVCAEQQLFKVIVDYREVVGPISTIDRLNYMEGADRLHNEYLKMDMPKLRLAYLAPRDLVINEPAVSNRREILSFDNIVTHDIESAKKWVMKESI